MKERNNMRNPDVSIVILNYNGGKDVIDCLESAKNIDYFKRGFYEIIVVDNGSTDDSVENIRKKFPEIRVIQNEKNLGFAEGNNVGIRESNCDYVMLLNDDTVVGESILKDLVGVMENNENIGIAGPMILYYNDPDRIWCAGGKLNLFGYSSHIGKGLKKDLQQPFKKALTKLLRKVLSKSASRESASQPVDYISGCAMLIKRGVIDKIGLLDAEYFLYFEDMDFCFRAKRAGYECVYIPSPSVWHKTTESWITNPVQAYYYMRNAIVFAKKNLNGFRRFIFIASQFFIMFPHHSFRLIVKRDFGMIKYLLKGLKDGFVYLLFNRLENNPIEK